MNIFFKLNYYGNIVKIHDYFTDFKNKAIFIVMQKADMNLEEMINKNPDGLSPDLLRQLLIDILLGLSYAYRHEIFHFDIKLTNILVCSKDSREMLLNISQSLKFEKCVFKLTDFADFGASKTAKKICRNHDFAPPEVIKSDKTPATNINFEKADVYAIAMVLLRCCGVKEAELKPINKINEIDLYNKKIQEVFLKIPKKYDLLTSSLKGMLLYENTKRESVFCLLSELNINIPKKNDGLTPKSILIFDIKVNDINKDLNSLRKKILEIKLDGLSWKEKYEIIPLAYGMNKLQMSCFIEDKTVVTEVEVSPTKIVKGVRVIVDSSITEIKKETKFVTQLDPDDLFEKILLLEEDVQSVDIVYFDKVN